MEWKGTTSMDVRTTLRSGLSLHGSCAGACMCCADWSRVPLGEINHGEIIILFFLLKRDAFIRNIIRYFCSDFRRRVYYQYERKNLSFQIAQALLRFFTIFPVEWIDICCRSAWCDTLTGGLCSCFLLLYHCMHTWPSFI